MRIDVYQPSHFESVKSLWEEAFPDDPPGNAADIAIPEKVAFQPELFFVALDEGRVVGTALAGYDGHRGWLYAVAVRQAARRSGIGRALVAYAESTLQAIGCRKINLQVRISNKAVASFYESLGYTVEDRLSLGKRF